MDQRNNGITLGDLLGSQDWEFSQVGNGFVFLPKQPPAAPPRPQRDLLVSSNPQRQGRNNQIVVNDTAYSNALTLHYAQQDTQLNDDQYAFLKQRLQKIGAQVQDAERHIEERRAINATSSSSTQQHQALSANASTLNVAHHPPRQSQSGPSAAHLQSQMTQTYGNPSIGYDRSSNTRSNIVGNPMAHQNYPNPSQRDPVAYQQQLNNLRAQQLIQASFNSNANVQMGNPALNPTHSRQPNGQFQPVASGNNPQATSYPRHEQLSQPIHPQLSGNVINIPEYLGRNAASGPTTRAARNQSQSATAHPRTNIPTNTGTSHADMLAVYAEQLRRAEEVRAAFNQRTVGELNRTSNGNIEPPQRGAQIRVSHGSKAPSTSAQTRSQIQLPQIPSDSIQGQGPSGSIPRMVPGGNQARVPVDQPPHNRPLDANSGATGSSSSGPSLGSSSSNIPNAASNLLGDQGNQTPTLARSIINALGKRKAADMAQSPVPSKRQALQPTTQLAQPTPEFQPPRPSFPNVPSVRVSPPSESAKTGSTPGIGATFASAYPDTSIPSIPAPEQAEVIEEIVPPRDSPPATFITRIIPNPLVVKPIVTEPESPSPRPRITSFRNVVSASPELDTTDLPAIEVSDDFVVPQDTSDILYISSSSPQRNQSGLYDAFENTRDLRHREVESSSLAQSDSEPLFYPSPSSSSSDIVEIAELPKQEKGSRKFDPPRRIFDGVYVPMQYPRLVPNGTRVEKEREGQPRPPLKYAICKPSNRSRRKAQGDSFIRPVDKDEAIRFALRFCRWDGCDAELDSFQRLQEHIEKVHLKGLRSLRCRWENCQQRAPFDSEQRLHRHVLAHAASSRYCMHADCDFRTKSQYALDRHIATVHDGDMNKLKPIVGRIGLPPPIPSEELPEFSTALEALQFPVHPDPSVDVRSLRTPSPKVSSRSVPTMLSPTKHARHYQDQDFDARLTDEYSFLEPFYQPNMRFDNLDPSPLAEFVKELVNMPPPSSPEVVENLIVSDIEDI